jgi:predicted enzyme related to lactoylglutathione lyase
MPTIVHFDISADDLDRAKRFYEELFNWKIEPLPGPTDYYLIVTTDLNGEMGVEGGMAKRDKPEQGIVNFISVPSVNEYITKVEKFGGKTVEQRQAVPGWGYLAVCLDTENNPFGLWEDNKDAR